MAESNATPKKPTSATKPATEADQAAPKQSVLGEYGRESAENLVKAQHVVADYVAEQSEVAAKYVKNRFQLKTTSSAGAAVDAAVRGVEHLTEAQKNLVDFVVEERPKATKKSTEKREAFRMPRVPVRRFLQRSLETVFDGQQELIGLAKAQGYLALESLTPLTQGRLMDAPAHFLYAAGQAVHNAIESQNRLLDLTTEYASETRTMLTEGDRAALSPETGDALLKGTEATLSMQKKLLNIASEQTTATVDRLAPGPKNAESAGERAGWVKVARDGIDRLSNAQLDMVDRTRDFVNRTLAAN